MRQVIIMRGLPGSSKSTLTFKIEQEYGTPAVICSADHYHYYGKPELPENYKFDIKNAGEAHRTCREKFLEAMQYNEELIIVDNTNINTKDYRFYFLKAIENNYNVTFHTIYNCSVEQSYKNNVHRVPFVVIENMFNNFQPTPKEIDGNLVDEISYDFNKLRENYGNNIKTDTQESKGLSTS